MRMIFNSIRKGMILFVLVIMYNISSIMLAQNTIPNYSSFSAKKVGYLVKYNNDTLKGDIQILETYPSIYFIPFKDYAESAILVDSVITRVKLQELKYIKYGDDLYKVFNLKEFPYGTYIAKLVDSPRIVNIYYGFEFILSKQISNINTFPNSLPVSNQPGFKIKDVYLIQIGNLTPEVFYNNFYHDYPFTVRDANFEKFEPNTVEVTLGVNYKKHLKNIFYYKSDVYSYIKGLKDISFYQLPQIVSEVNKRYK